MLAKLVARINRERFSCAVVSMTEPGPLGPRITASGTPVHSLNLSRGIPNPLAIPKLASVIRDFQPHILQTWMYHANLLGLIAARATQVKSVVWNIRSSDLDLQNVHRKLRFIIKAHAFFSRFADTVIVNSASGMHFHQAMGHHPRHWKLIQNGFDLDRFCPSSTLRASGRARLRVDDNSVVIGMVARHHPQKDHETFIAAAEILCRSQPNVVFALAGTGLVETNIDLSSRLKRANLMNNTRLLGEIADPSQLFPSLDINTLCSAYGEGFPNALGEAMSCEIPCVATDVGDSASLLGDTGLVIPTRAPQALADAWRKLITLGPEGRHELGASGRARIREHFSIKAIVTAYEDLYENIAGGTNRAPMLDRSLD